jgi:hypothetical protein
MAEPLGGAKLKVVRAQEHLDALKGEITTYLQTKPYRPDINFDEEPGRVVIRANVSHPPPERLSLFVGDCVSNLNAALDHVAWALALKFRAPAPVVGDKIYYLRPDSFTRGQATMDSVAMARLQAAQPATAGYEPLATLRDLVNEDKHRLLLLTVAMVPFMFRIWLGGTVEDISFPPDHAGAARLSYFLRGAPREYVRVQGYPFVYVALQNPPVPQEPVDVTLENLIKCVARAVATFEPLFP